MRVKLTLRRPAAPLTDVVVMADSTATIADVARQIATTDPARSIAAAPADVLTLSVAPPTSEQLTMLNPDLLVGDAPIGSGFLAEVVNVGPNRVSVGGAGTRPAAVLTVVAGPAAGQEFPLPIGHFLIGRDGANDVTIADPLVSKRHARIEVAATFVELVDLNSANGILVDGGLVQRLRVIPGQSFALGDCEFVVHMVSDFDGSASGDPVLERGGALMFNRSPRVEERFTGQELDEPRYPRDQPSRLFPGPCSSHRSCWL